MNQVRGPGTISCMGDEREARSPYEHVPIRSGQGTTSKQDKVIDSAHLECLDLATAFHKITIKDTKHKVQQKCKVCGFIQCKCPAFT